MILKKTLNKNNNTNHSFFAWQYFKENFRFSLSAKDILFIALWKKVALNSFETNIVCEGIGDLVILSMI